MRGRLLRNLKSRYDDFKNEATERSSGVVSSILRPKRFERFVEEGNPDEWTSQIVALMTLPMVIVISLVMIVVVNDVATDVFGGSVYQDSNQENIVGWLITALTGGMVILAAWTWFQFVRTSGFGFFKF